LASLAAGVSLVSGAQLATVPQGAAVETGSGGLARQGGHASAGHLALPGGARAAGAGRGDISAIGQGLTWASFIVLSASLATRAIVVGRGPWGNMYEFSIAFAVG
jgi:hypothetical protein